MSRRLVGWMFFLTLAVIGAGMVYSWSTLGCWLAQPKRFFENYEAASRADVLDAVVPSLPAVSREIHVAIDAGSGQIWGAFSYAPEPSPAPVEPTDGPASSPPDAASLLGPECASWGAPVWPEAPCDAPWWPETLPARLEAEGDLAAFRCGSAVRVVLAPGARRGYFWTGEAAAATTAKTTTASEETAAATAAARQLLGEQRTIR